MHIKYSKMVLSQDLYFMFSESFEIPLTLSLEKTFPECKKMLTLIQYIVKQFILSVLLYSKLLTMNVCSSKETIASWNIQYILSDSNLRPRTESSNNVHNSPTVFHDLYTPPPPSKKSRMFHKNTM